MNSQTTLRQKLRPQAVGSTYIIKLLDVLSTGDTAVSLPKLIPYDVYTQRKQILNDRLDRLIAIIDVNYRDQVQELLKKPAQFHVRLLDCDHILRTHIVNMIAILRLIRMQDQNVESNIAYEELVY